MSTELNPRLWPILSGDGSRGRSIESLSLRSGDDRRGLSGDERSCLWGEYRRGGVAGGIYRADVGVSGVEATGTNGFLVEPLFRLLDCSSSMPTWPRLESISLGSGEAATARIAIGRRTGDAAVGTGACVRTGVVIGAAIRAEVRLFATEAGAGGGAMSA